jgi:uncharacterized membrane protein YecN with MAPEG domain
VHACGVNRRTCVHAYGLNNHALGARSMGVNLIFLMLFMVHVADLGLFYVAVGDHFARCQLVGESGIGHS